MSHLALHNLLAHIAAGLNIPNNAIAFSHSISAALAHSAPHLTLDFLKEWTIGFSKGEISQKCAALNYVGPWLDKLDLFARPTRERSDVAAGIQSVQEIVRTLVTITLAERRVSSANQESIPLLTLSACIYPYMSTCGPDWPGRMRAW